MAISPTAGPPSSPGLGSTIFPSTPGSGGPTEPITLSMGQCGEGRAGGFGQTVGLQDVDAEGVEVVSDLRIEARAAGDQVAHAVAEGAVQLAEEDPAGIEARLARRPRLSAIRAFSAQPATLPRLATSLKMRS